MPVDKARFINTVKEIFNRGMTEAIKEGLKASIKSEDPIYNNSKVSQEMEKTINKMAKRGSDKAAEEFVKEVSEDLCKTIDEYIRECIKNTYATLTIPPNGALTCKVGDVTGTVLIKFGDLKVN